MILPVIPKILKLILAAPAELLITNTMLIALPVHYICIMRTKTIFILLQMQQRMQ